MRTLVPAPAPPLTIPLPASEPGEAAQDGPVSGPSPCTLDAQVEFLTAGFGQDLPDFASHSAFQLRKTIKTSNQANKIKNAILLYVTQ